MSIVDKLLGGETRRKAEEYEELDLEKYEDDLARPEYRKHVHIAEIRGQEGVMEVKDLVYDGEIVLADVSHFLSNERRLEEIIESLRKVADEVGGDIVQKGDSQLIVTPSGIGVSREKIAR